MARSRRPVLVHAAALVAAGLAAFLLPRRTAPEAPPVSPGRIEAAPPCPWRDPGADLAAFFPGADHVSAELLVLSALRPELARRLGRAPGPDDNAVRLHHAMAGGRELGVVAVRRVKGEGGAIEVVAALAPDGALRGLRYQRLREPEATDAFLRSDAWLRGFAGRRAGDALRPGTDLASPPDGARNSAEAVAAGVRELLALIDAGAAPGAVRRPVAEASGPVANGHGHGGD